MLYSRRAMRTSVAIGALVCCHSVAIAQVDFDTANHNFSGTFGYTYEGIDFPTGGNDAEPPFFNISKNSASGGTSGGIIDDMKNELSRVRIGMNAESIPQRGFTPTTLSFSTSLSVFFDHAYDTMEPLGPGIGIAETGFQSFVSFFLQFEVTHATPYEYLITSTVPTDHPIDLSLVDLSISIVDSNFNQVLPGKGILEPGIFEVFGVLNFVADPGQLGTDLLGNPFEGSVTYELRLPTPGATVLGIIALWIAGLARRRPLAAS